MSFQDPKINGLREVIIDNNVRDRELERLQAEETRLKNIVDTLLAENKPKRCSAIEILACLFFTTVVLGTMTVLWWFKQI